MAARIHEKRLLAFINRDEAKYSTGVHETTLEVQNMAREILSLRAVAASMERAVAEAIDAAKCLDSQSASIALQKGIDAYRNFIENRNLQGATENVEKNKP